MAKSKVHTNHNQGKKNHRNGIKRPLKQRYASTKGMDAKYLRNLKYVKKGNAKVRKELEKQKEAK
jgi:large subunit ribosomal protein L29e